MLRALVNLSMRTVHHGFRPELDGCKRQLRTDVLDLEDNGKELYPRRLPGFASFPLAANGRQAPGISAFHFQDRMVPATAEC